MATRRQIREWAMHFLFQRDFNVIDDLEPALAAFWSDKPLGRKQRGFAEELVRGVLDHQEEIDGAIQRYAEHWDIDRMGKVDRNIMRVALYEMLYRDDVPPVVSINEAVSIAKDYSGRESGRFVNGILDRARKDIDRPAREARS